MSSSSSTPSLQHLYKEVRASTEGARAAPPLRWLTCVLSPAAAAAGAQAYQLTDRANVGSFAAHEFAPVHMLLVQRGSDDDTPLTDVQAAQNAFTSLYVDRRRGRHSESE